ncbi:Kdo hydroxylase family protein [Candidatus Korobacter versatilis]|nr:Kdo hydroxylase family protein [Candidatus Koribacter versatilis]
MNTSPACSVVTDYTRDGWTAADRSRDWCSELESGKILLFDGVPFDLPSEDRDFLLSQKQAASRFHKNISYRPEKNILRGIANDSPDRERMQQVMGRYSREVVNFVMRFLAPYARDFKLDYASFRPLEEKSRDLVLHKRNDLLHVDAFPTRPTRGARILRVFTNINPIVDRVWTTGEPFHVMAPGLARPAGLPHFANPSLAQRFVFATQRAGHVIGLPFPNRSRYDRFMLHFHDWLKENSNFQQNSPKVRTDFSPGCSWLVYTDGVPHAVLSGQYVLEQTFIIPQRALVAPERSPLQVLETIANTSLAS